MARPANHRSAHTLRLLAHECGLWLAERINYGRGMLPIMLLRQVLGADEEERKVIVRRNRTASVLRCWVSPARRSYADYMDNLELTTILFQLRYIYYQCL